MAGSDHSPADPIRIEPEDRLVILARTMQIPVSDADGLWNANADTRTSLGETFLGRALYRHRSVFQSASNAPVWSHLDLSYFRDIVPDSAIGELVFGRQPAPAWLLRAEILLTTPAAFVMPRRWRGSKDRPDRVASLEYIDVRPPHLGEYRNVMRTYIGPAAAKLVGRGEIGTFRAMETAAVLYRSPSFDVDWNQIHLCEVDEAGFEGFGQTFDAALREIAPDGGFADVFAGLDRIRTMSRWTFNEALIEADAAIGQLGAAKPSC